MKIKQHLYITDPEKFMKGDTHSCFNLFGSKGAYDGWIDCGEVEFDVDVDTGKVLEAAQTELDIEISNARAALLTLENRKNDLLALPGTS